MMIKISVLILDDSVYPRTKTDPIWAGRLAVAISNGAELPPIVVCRATNRVVDGFHRVAAYRKLYGDDYKVNVTKKTYVGDEDLFMDAVELNAQHGRPLTTQDHAKCSHIAATLDISTDAIAAKLSISVDNFARAATRATAHEAGSSAPIFIKNTIKFKHGQTLTPSQVDANEKLGGNNQSFYFNQCIILIENDLLDTNNEALMERVERLGEVIAALSISVA